MAEGTSGGGPARRKTTRPRWLHKLMTADKATQTELETRVQGSQLDRRDYVKEAAVWQDACSGKWL